jgi:hypothetical protein
VLVIKAVSPADVVPINRTSAGGSYVLSDYIGSYASVDSDTGFQAFLVEQRSPELRAHFHEVDQFQIVVDGSGTLGRQPVRVGAVHYTDGYTSYGPIRTDDPTGLAYFTLRLQPTVGANYMPESRQKRDEGHGHGGHFTCQVDLDVTAAGIELIGESPRGARAYACALPAGQSLLVEDLGPGRGYAVVLQGTVRDGERELPRRTVIPFQRPAELGALTAEADTALALVTFPDAA